MRTMFLLHEQRFFYDVEPSYVELYLPMRESGLLGETLVHPYQRDLRFVSHTLGLPTGIDSRPSADVDVRVEHLLSQKLLEFRPELVVYALTWPQECIPAVTLARLRERHGFKLVSVIWDHDESNPLLQAYDRDILAVSDCTIVADSLSRTQAIRARSGPYAGFVHTERARFLPMVPPTALFHPRPQRQHEITVSGSSEGHRVAACEKLAAAGLAVHRSGGMAPGDTLLSVEQYAADLAVSRIVVNTQTLGSRVQLKGRVAQCLASGTFLLEQDNPESRAYLAGIDVVFWRDEEELVALARRWLADDAGREELARRTHAQWKARYHARAFVQTVLDAVDPGAVPAVVRAAASTLASTASPPPAAPAVPAAAAARLKDPTMRFSIHSGNHNNSGGIADTVLLLRNGLRDCGHVASISHGIPPGQVNVVMEHFTEEKHLQALIDGRAKGARYVLVGTEPIVGGTFNGGIDDSHWHYSNRAYWKLRFDAFKVAAGLAEAIWVLAESMLPAYQALFPNLPVRFVPHGWVSDFDTVRHRPADECDIDFFFSGSLTGHRRRILGELGQRHRVVCLEPGAPEYLRQDALARTKVCLSLRLSERNEIPSVSRMHYHLQNRNFLLHERYALPCPLDPFVLQAESADFCEWAVAALQMSNRREVAEGVHDQFRQALPMSRLMAPLIDEVLGRIAADADPAQAA
jgi:hypothetical protein